MSAEPLALSRYLRLLLAFLGTLSCIPGQAEQKVFGISLDTPVPAEILGASRATAPAPLLLGHPAAPAAAESDSQVPAPWHADGHWWYATPQHLPKLLRHSNPRLLLAVDNSRQPYWLRLRARATACIDDSKWLHSALKARYPSAQWFGEDGNEVDADALLSRIEEHPEQVTRLQSADLQIGFRCDAFLHLEYLRTSVLKRAHAEHLAQQEVEDVHTDRAIARLLQKSSGLIQGDRYALTEILGLSALTQGLLTQPAGTPLPLDLRRYSPIDPEREPLLRGADIQATVDSNGALMKLEAVMPDLDAQQFQQWQTLLKAQFVAPRKDRPKHQIYHFGSQRLILRRGKSATHLVFMDMDRRKQEQRKAQQQAQAQFAEDTEGL